MDNYNHNKADELALALLYLNAFEDEFLTRSWKNISWDIMDRLHEKDLIHDPKGKSKSISFTPEGLEKAKELFEKLLSE